MKARDFLGIGTVLYLLLASLLLMGEMWLGALGALVMAAVMMPMFTSLIARVIKRDRLPMAAGFLIGFFGLMLPLTLGASQANSDYQREEAIRHRELEAKQRQAMKEQRQALGKLSPAAPATATVPPAPALKSMGDGVVFNAKELMTKSPEVVAQYLGKPVSREVTADGDQREYKIGKLDVMVVYGVQGAKWVTLKMPSKDGYAIPIPGLKPGSEMLEALGLEAEDPDHTGLGGERWEAVQGLGRISTTVLENGAVVYVGIHLNKD
jgi:hypothetical protein